MSGEKPNIGVPEQSKNGKRAGIARYLPWFQNNGQYQIYIEPMATVKDPSNELSNTIQS